MGLREKGRWCVKESVCYGFLAFCSRCDNFSGIIQTHSLSGGTGSGNFFFFFFWWSSLVIFEKKEEEGI